MDRNYSIAEARDQLAKIVHAVERGKSAKLTRRGKPVAVLVSLANYERIQAGAGGFFEAMMAWREQAAKDGVFIEPKDLGDLRDKSPGRDVRF